MPKVSRQPSSGPSTQTGFARLFVTWFLLLVVLSFFAEPLVRTWEPSFALRQSWSLEGRSLAQGKWWTPFTYVLLHFDHWHLSLNVSGLALFGLALSERWQWRHLALLTIGASLGGAGLWLAFHHGQRGAVIGASAILCAYVTAYALEQPRARVPLVLTRWGFPRWILLALLIAIEGLGLLQESRSRLLPQALSHSAHLGGVAVAMVISLWVRLRKTVSSTL
jgi:membrane associated rhomboid family serine protease